MRKHILVIDDNAGIRDAFILAFKNTEYQLDTAETGEEGLEKERSKKYDLIFLDLKMPGIGGIEVLRKIRLVNKETPVYILTAFYKELANELKFAKKEGLAYEIIQKPIRSDQILLVTRSVLEEPIAY
jgi:CheY-like chemotaxis protein